MKVCEESKDKEECQKEGMRRGAWGRRVCVCVCVCVFSVRG